MMQFDEHRVCLKIRHAVLWILLGDGFKHVFSIWPGQLNLFWWTPGSLTCFDKHVFCCWGDLHVFETKKRFPVLKYSLSRWCDGCEFSRGCGDFAIQGESTRGAYQSSRNRARVAQEWSARATWLLLPRRRGGVPKADGNQFGHLKTFFWNRRYIFGHPKRDLERLQESSGGMTRFLVEKQNQWKTIYIYPESSGGMTGCLVEKQNPSNISKSMVFGCLEGKTTSTENCIPSLKLT